MKKDFTILHEKMIKDNTTRSTTNKEDIGELKITDATMTEKLLAVCQNMNALTKVLWFLATTWFLTLIGIVIDYVLTR